jgi:hypothetical protein
VQQRRWQTTLVDQVDVAHKFWYFFANITPWGYMQQRARNAAQKQVSNTIPPSLQLCTANQRGFKANTTAAIIHELCVLL